MRSRPPRRGGPRCSSVRSPATPTAAPATKAPRRKSRAYHFERCIIYSGSVGENVLKRSIALVRPIGSSYQLRARRNGFGSRRLHHGFVRDLIVRLAELVTDKSANDKQRRGGDQSYFRPATEHRPPALFAPSR